MTNNKHLYFLSDVGRKKFLYQKEKESCPFCNRQELTDVLAEDGSIILLKNKFPTLEGTFQTVIIETDECLANMSNYDTEHMRKVISFGIKHWLAMEESGEYKSVVFYKNHGPLSGGTIDHAHMQIVGLKNIDYRENLNDEIFEGIEIYREGESILNISTKPNTCATEFNIITTDCNENFMAENIQKIVKYILNHFRCSSFNLFFYQWREAIICKIVPRYVVSPFLIGFSIPQTSNRIRSIVQELQEMYYGSPKK